jgi:hypothetical protein
MKHSIERRVLQVVQEIHRCYKVLGKHYHECCRLLWLTNSFCRVHQVRKGMVLVAESAHPAASWEFDADIAILTHSTTIQPRYQAVIHCEIIRQAARVVAMDQERLRSGDRCVAGCCVWQCCWS